MMILFDTCIVLDSLLKREPFNNESDILFELAANRQIEGLLTVKSMMDIHYILKKLINDEKQTRKILINLSEIFEVVNSTTYDCLKSLTSKMNDYEDAMMSQTGETLRVDFFVTRNLKDYKYSSLKVCSPKEMLKILNEAH